MAEDREKVADDTDKAAGNRGRMAKSGEEMAEDSKDSPQKREKKQEMDELDPHSERIDKTPSRQQAEERDRERAREKPETEGKGRKPVELRTTSKSDLDRRIEEKEGPQAGRTREEMSLHEEISRTKDEEPKDDA